MKNVSKSDLNDIKEDIFAALNLRFLDYPEFWDLRRKFVFLKQRRLSLFYDFSNPLKENIVNNIKKRSPIVAGPLSSFVNRILVLERNLNNMNGEMFDYAQRGLLEEAFIRLFRNKLKNYESLLNRHKSLYNFEKMILSRQKQR